MSKLALISDKLNDIAKDNNIKEVAVILPIWCNNILVSWEKHLKLTELEYIEMRTIGGILYIVSPFADEIEIDYKDKLIQ